MSELEHFTFYCFEKDTILEYHLLLAEREAVIALGNLTIHGAMIDFYYNEDDHSLVKVCGNLSVTNLISGSSIHVDGNLTVQSTIYANSYGLDTIKVEGTLQADVLIDEGHEIDCQTINVRAIYASPGMLPTYIKFRNAKKINPAIFVDKKLFTHFVDQRRLFKSISQGRPIVREGN